MKIFRLLILLLSNGLCQQPGLAKLLTHKLFTFRARLKFEKWRLSKIRIIIQYRLLTCLINRTQYVIVLYVISHITTTLLTTSARVARDQRTGDPREKHKQPRACLTNLILFVNDFSQCKKSTQSFNAVLQDTTNRSDQAILVPKTTLFKLKFCNIA